MRIAHRPSTVLAALAVVGLVLAGCSSDSGSDDDAASSSDTTAAPTVTEFSVLSYNVAGLPQEISGENPAANIPLISPLLAPYDIVMTQEDFDWWTAPADSFDFVNYHTRLRAETGHPHASGQHPGPDAVGLVTGEDRPAPFVGDGLGLLSIFPFTEPVRVPWVGCFGGIDTDDGGAGDCLAMKGFMVSTITLAPGVEVDLYNLHGEAGGCGPDQPLQASGMEQLADYMVEHSAGRAVILGGDTNLHTDDVHPDACGNADTPIWDTFLARTGLTDVCTALSCDKPGAIDKMAFRSGGDVELEALTWKFETEIFVDAAGEPLSDHNALHVRFGYS
jgi:hypothetical protein